MLCQRCHVATRHPGVDLRQRRDHGEQEQPDVRTIVRELPLERPRLEPPVRPVLHAIGAGAHMRPARADTLVTCCLALVVAPRRRRANPPPPTPATAAADQPADPQAAPHAQEPAAPAAPSGEERRAACSNRRWRQFQFGGRFSSVDGDPARFQRYRTSGTACSSPMRATRGEHPTGDWGFEPRPTTSAGATSDTSANYERPAGSPISGLWDQIPQFYSVDTKTPYTGRRTSTLVLDDATQRAIQNAPGQHCRPTSRSRRSSICANAATSAT